MADIEVLKAALAGLKAAYDAYAATDSDNMDEWDSVSRRLSYIVQDLKRVVKDVWIDDKVFSMSSEAEAIEGFTTEAGAKFSRASLDAITSALAALKSLVDSSDDEDTKTQTKEALEATVSVLEACAADAEKRKTTRKAIVPEQAILAAADEPAVPKHLDFNQHARSVTGGHVFAESSKPASNQFRMLVIKEGLSGNRVNYSNGVLRESVPLLDGRPIYLDHPQGAAEGRPQPRSVTTKVGWWSDPKFEEGLQLADGSIVNGITATANILENSPAGYLPAMLTESLNRGKPDLVGVSIFAAGDFKNIQRGTDGRPFREATKITRYFSADFVAEPGAAGQALAIENLMEVDPQLEEIEKLTLDDLRRLRPDLVAEMTPAPAPAPVPDPAATQIVTEMQSLLDSARREQTRTRAMNLVAESNLGNGIRDVVLEEIGDRILSEDDIKAVVSKYARVSLAVAESLNTGAQNAGLGRMIIPFGGNVVLEGQISPLDQTIWALEDFFGNPVPDTYKGKFPKIRSFAEYYRQVTGDRDVQGVYVPSQSVIGSWLGRTFAETAPEWLATFAEGAGSLPGATHVIGAGTISMTNLLAAVQNKALIRQYRGQTQWWRPIVRIGDMNDLKTQTRIRLHNFGSLTTRSSRATEYTELDWGETQETFAPKEIGNVVTVDRWAIINDDLRGIQRIPGLLGQSAAVTLNEDVAALFTANSGNGPTLADSVQVFNAASHQGNRITQAMDYDSVLDARKIMMKMNNDAGKRISVIPRYLLVPVDLEATAYKLVNSAREPGNANNDPNVLANPSTGLRQPIMVPQFTDTNNWYLMCDPNESQVETIEVAFLFGREEPEFFVQDQPTNGMVFTHDVMAFKIRHNYAMDWLDYRGAVASIVA